MKILHVYKRSMPHTYGGVETFIDTLCKYTSKLECENIVFTLHPKPRVQPIKMDGYTVRQAKQDFFLASTGFSFSAFILFKKLAKEADIIHYHFPNPFADLLCLFCRIKKPSLVTYHSDIIKQKYFLKIYSPFKNLFLNSVNKIVATSPNYLDSSETLIKYKEKVSVIPIGIDIEKNDTVDPNKIKYWSGQLQQPFFLFVGALRYYKGLHILLEAIVGTDIKLVIAGTGDIEMELKSLANTLGLDNILFLGLVGDEDKAALLHLCYGFVFPSHLRSEAFGVSLLEAACTSKPMICCEIGTGTTFINIANETGLVISPSCPKDLRNAMQYLLDSPSVAAEMGKRARVRAVKVFNAEVQAKSYFDLYQSIQIKI